MNKILNFTILISLIYNIANEIYQHNVDATIAFCVALFWFGMSWYYERKKRIVVNIFTKKNDEEEKTNEEDNITQD